MNHTLNALIEEYEKEINIFWDEPDSKEKSYNSWDLIMMTYEELCKKLPFNPFVIIKDKVYLEGEYECSFKEAMFYAVGECCKRYNNREFPIKYI